ncbi:UNVERIFIED_CONTAM: formate/nitrite transporter protein [Hammondia hammondi]|eukprot:XP_008886967.1 formate/nitrite transporter protein [Hammondia hammondi]
MVVTASPDTYLHVIDYGLKKVRLRFDRLLLQAFMAGVYIGMAGNACISLAGGFSTDATDPKAITAGTQKFIYASIFPVAFIAIIMTGAELFTGNTMTMLICWFERRITIWQLLQNWAGSFLGNWLGTMFSAYFLTYLCCPFDHDPYLSYLNYTAASKVSYGWGSCFLRGVGCNTWVCLAVWFVVACDDAAGKILALWFPIVAFVLSSYEHIIANLYTLQLCAMLGVDTSLADMIAFNLLPTLLGNLCGGCGLIGMVYFYNFYPVVGHGDAAAEGSICGSSEKEECPSLVGVPRGASVNSLAVSAIPSVFSAPRGQRESFAGESSTLVMGDIKRQRSMASTRKLGGGADKKDVQLTMRQFDETEMQSTMEDMFGLEDPRNAPKGNPGANPPSKSPESSPTGGTGAAASPTATS